MQNKLHEPETTKKLRTTAKTLKMLMKSLRTHQTTQHDPEPRHDTDCPFVLIGPDDESLFPGVAAAWSAVSLTVIMSM